MAILKSRPKIILRLPTVLHPGGDFVAEAVLDAKRAVEVERVFMTLEGTDWAVHGSGDSATTLRQPVASLRADACGTRELPAGRTVLPARFSLPPECPPSYFGGTAGCKYTMDVHAVIDWWPDAKSSFEVVLKPRARPGIVEAKAGLYSTRPGGPLGDEAHVELSLSTHDVTAGDVISGSVALANVASNRYQRIVLALVGVHHMFDRQGRSRGTREAHRYQRELPVGRAVEGAAIPFSLALPASLFPSWGTRLWRLEWNMDVKADLGWGKGLSFRVPIRIHPSGTIVERTRNAPPAVGSARFRRAWEQVAAETVMQLTEEFSLRGRVGAVDITVRRDHRGDRGVFLSGTLAFPTLRLGLDGGLASSFRRMVGGGVLLGDAKWDKHHYVTGREEAQAHALVHSLRKGLVRLRLEDAHDEALVLSRRDAGHSAANLRRFVDELLAIARALPVAAAAVPVPAVMAEAAESWRELAQAMGTTLLTGPVGVVGELDGMPAGARTRWNADGAARDTKLWVRPGFEIDRDRRFEVLGEVSDTVPTEHLSADARAVLPMVVKGTERLLVGAEWVEAWMGAPQLDAGVVHDALRRMVRFAALLRTGAGPYR